MMQLNQVRLTGGGANFPWRIWGRCWVVVEHDDTSVTTRGHVQGTVPLLAAAQLRVSRLLVCWSESRN